jgi:hypothetical protein
MGGRELAPNGGENRTTCQARECIVRRSRAYACRDAPDRQRSGAQRWPLAGGEQAAVIIHHGAPRRAAAPRQAAGVDKEADVCLQSNM